MSDPHRTSRADRRRGQNNEPSSERRQPKAQVTMTAHSQLLGAENQVFVKSPITSDNCSVAREILTQHCQRYQSPILVVDLEHCAYMDTPGLSLLFEFRKDALNHGRDFLLQNPSRAVLRIMNITRMARVFRIRITSQNLQKIAGARNEDNEKLGQGEKLERKTAENS